LVYSDGIPVVPNIPRKRKMLGIPYPGTKIEVKLLEFHSEPFRRREISSDFRFMEQK
jgi:hypothetical protein